MANSKDDITQAKIDEAMHYMRATQGQALSDDDAVKKREGEEKRKEELAKQRAMAGNTKEANQRLASLSGGASIQSTGHLERASGTNISTRQQAKSESQALFESAKVDIVLEDENNLRELILDLKEPDREDYDEYNWMIIGYVEDKKNALELVETGNDTREGVADYIKAELGGGLDRVMYLLLKEDNAVQKITFISWMGKNVPALKRANATTHRGAIVSWISSIVQSRQEEHVSCCAELLGLKDEEAEEEGALTEGDKVDNVKELEERISSKPYLGKVLSDVQREKTPHEQWLERKEALAKGGGVIAKVSSGDTSILNDSSAVGSPDFTRVQLKNNDTERSLRKGVGRSKFAQRSRSDRELDRSTGEVDGDATRSKPSIENASKAELREMMRKAEEEAAKLAEEAERRKEELRKLQQAMVDADSPSKSHGGDGEREEEQAMSPGELEGQKRARKEEEEKERAAEEEAAKVKAEEEAQARQEAVEREREKEEARRKEEEEAKVAKEREEARAKEEEERKENEKAAAAAAAAAAAEEEKARAANEREEKERKEREQAAAAAAAASEAAARKEAEEKEAAAAAKIKAEEEEKRAAALAEEEAREARLAAARKAQEEARANAEKEIAARREANEAKADGSGMATRKAELLAEADSSKRSEEDAIRKKAEELLARKKALLEEAARKQSMGAPSPARSPLAGQDGNQDRDRLKRAEEFRQRKMAELASRKGGDVDAASKKAAFLREAEEAVRRAAQQENTKKRDDDKRRITSMPVATGSLTAALSDDSDESEATPGNTPSKNMAKPMRA